MDTLSLLIGFIIGLIIMGTILFIVHTYDKKQIEIISTQLPEKFSNIAHQTLHENEKEFHNISQQSQEPINNLVNQLRFEITEMERSRKVDYGNLLARTGELSKETQKLNKILDDSQMRGYWGESTLKRIVELCGMVEHCDFITQDVQDGIRPDMIIKLPNHRSIIVDSKTPQKAYNAAVTCDDTATRTAYFEQHAKLVKAKVDELSRKEYQNQYNSPDFVVLFMPNDQLLASATKVNSYLIEEAMEKHVVIATPSTLYSLLMSVKCGWNENNLTDNALKIADLGKQLADGINKWFKDLQETGKYLNKAVEAYNSGINHLDKKIIPCIEKMQEYGVNKADTINADFEIVEKETIESKRIT